MIQEAVKHAQKSLFRFVSEKGFFVRF